MGNVAEVHWLGALVYSKGFENIDFLLAEVRNKHRFSGHTKKDKQKSERLEEYKEKEWKYSWSLLLSNGGEEDQWGSCHGVYGLHNFVLFQKIG